MMITEAKAEEILLADLATSIFSRCLPGLKVGTAAVFRPIDGMALFGEPCAHVGAVRAMADGNHASISITINRPARRRTRFG
ncbi:hypothetical protein BLJAPNOD_02381 [Ensifer sp. M14]|uniref:hypothetical protein n=1 Tax=Ensifer sp. M14 TaxID=2203782 RepID=UPI000E1D5DE3|nr:hypothetical protein [Ensifer sp. M14]RDL51249.1 hypothetical protein BLJAPNOD_02381 [Ensifer sp. M14]